MPDIHFECPRCAQTLDAPEELANQLFECPMCKETIEVPTRSRLSPPVAQSPMPAPPTLSQPVSPAPTLPPSSQQQRPSTAHQVKKSEFVGIGAAVQAVGCLAFLGGAVLCTTVLGVLFGIVGIIIGLLLLIIGGRMAIKLVCSNCGNKLSGKEVKICPVCHLPF